MGWGTRPDDVLPYLPLGRPVRGAPRRRPLRPHRATGPDRRCRARPHRAAGMSPFRRPRPRARWSGTAGSSWRSTSCGPRRHRRHPPTTPGPCSSSTVSASEPSTSRPSGRQAWPGAVWGLDFTGHGASTVPVGGGYSAELLMGDADAALAELGPATAGRPGARRLRRPPDRRRPADARAWRRPHGRSRVWPAAARPRRRPCWPAATGRPGGRPTRGRCPSCPGTCAQPTTPRASPARPRSCRGWSGRWPCARSPARRGSRPSPRRPACSTARSPKRIELYAAGG